MTNIFGESDQGIVAETKRYRAMTIMCANDSKASIDEKESFVFDRIDGNRVSWLILPVAIIDYILYFHLMRLKRAIGIEPLEKDNIKPKLSSSITIPSNTAYHTRF